jgi:alkanesulfonate monooxygenase SsuD/methylene tetrahydromethanopterin reductase-like flavin-dependent oxidoreductase (luciferase family)
MLLAGVAGATSSIRLGTTSYLLTLRHPLLAAEQVAVLDQLSGGRVILGVGRGYAPDMLRAFNVVPREKREVFENTLEIMRQAWSGAPLQVEGTAGITVAPRPLQQPHPPIWVAAIGPKALAQAGRLRLPYLASPMESLALLESNYASHREAGGAGVECVPVMRTVHVTQSRAETEDLKNRLREMARPAVVRADAQTAGVDDWAIVGETAYVAEKVHEYREVLGMTHMITARLRLPGLDMARVFHSVTRLPEIVAGL